MTEKEGRSASAAMDLAAEMNLSIGTDISLLRKLYTELFRLRDLEARIREADPDWLRAVEQASEEQEKKT